MKIWFRNYFNFSKFTYSKIITDILSYADFCQGWLKNSLSFTPECMAEDWYAYRHLGKGQQLAQPLKSHMDKVMDPYISMRWAK